ncbi:hypothetical protein GCM10027578_31430 [Spirosoma luteolum]
MLDMSLPTFSGSASTQPTTTVTPASRAVFGKRFFDVLIALLLLIFILSWLLPLIGILVRLTSPGPALFIQLRMGRNGVPFRCLKFRTMTFDPNGEFRQAQRNDPRITKLGAFLRKSNLDELPQLINVLTGQMSLVGPRPHPLRLDAEHWHTMANYPNRYAVRPGITGLAQARGCRGETAELIQMQHRLRLDLFYIQKRSMKLDLMICWWTLAKMILGDEKAH